MDVSSLPEPHRTIVKMRFGNPGDNSAYKPTGMPYDVGVFPLGPSGTKRGVGGGGTGWAIAGPTKQPEEAWAFLQLITSKEAQLGEVGIGQTTPSRTSVATRVTAAATSGRRRGSARRRATRAAGHPA